MHFGVLGPLTVTRDGAGLHVGGPKQRLALALLLRAEGRAVSTDSLVDGVWGEEPPVTARKTLQGYIHHLRSELGDIVRTEANGYSIETGGEVDSIRFDELQREGRELLASDPARAAEVLREALALWNGPAYADLDSEPALGPEIARLENLRVDVLGDRIDADLATGGHAALIGELDGLTQEFPLQERFRAQHMVALYRSGRQVEALRAFERTRRYLADEIGLDPSAELQTLESQILARDAVLDLDTTVVSDDPVAVRGYELRELVRTGPATEIHRAYQRSVGREVAVRILGPEIANDPTFIADFVADTQRVAALEHPHIVFVFDTWREPDRAYQVSRWLAGGTLEDSLQQATPALATALRLLDQVGGALGYAHRQGVVHGRVQAECVLLDESGNAYLSDFAVGRSPIGLSEAVDMTEFAALAHRVVGGRVPRSASSAMTSDLSGAELPAAVSDVFEVAFSPESYARVEDFLRALRQAAGVDVVPTAAAEPVRVDVRNPYKGLRAFREADSDDFFGRDELIERLSETLDRNRLVAVVGPSGSGKSSVVRAGLAARLRLDDHGPVRLVTEMFPGAFPFEELESALLRVGINRISVINELLGDGRGLVRVLKQILPDEDTELVLVVDQFEELFSAVGDETVRTLFLDSLVNAVGDPRSRLRVVVTMRADFFDRPLRYPEFGALVEAGLVPVSMPDDDGLRAAIAQPARSVGVELDDGLVDRILHDIGDQPGGLPVMQYALTELFDEREGNRLTLAGYQRTGGVFGALGRRAEELYEALDGAGQHAIRQAFLRLVTVDEGADDLRRRVRRVELTAEDVDDRALTSAINLYGAHRLLTFDLDPTTRGPTVEVAHEALLREWDRLRGWVEAERDDLIIRRRLDAAMAEWAQAGEDPSYLPGGGRLAQFQEWSETTSLSLTLEERGYLEAGIERERVAAAKVAGRRRRLTVGLGVVAGVLAVLAVFAVVQQRRADDSAAEAERAAFVAETGRLGADAAIQSASNPALGLLLAAEAHNRDAGVPSLSALQRAMLRTGHYLGVFGEPARNLMWVPGHVVAFNRDELSIYDDSTRELEHRVALSVNTRPASFEAFYPEAADGEPDPVTPANSGEWVAVGTEGAEVALVDLDSGGVTRFATPADVTALAASTDDSLLAVGHQDGRTTIYRTDDLSTLTTIDPLVEGETFDDIDWDNPDFAGCCPVYEAGVFTVSAIAFDETGGSVAIAQGAQTTVFDTASGEARTTPALLASFDAGFPMMAQEIFFTEAEIWVWHSNTFTRIERTTGETLSVVALLDDPFFGKFRGLELAANGNLLLLTDKRLLELEPTSTTPSSRGFETATFVRAFSVPTEIAEGLALAPDGNSWAVSGADGVVVGSLGGGNLLATSVPKPTSDAETINVGHDGALVSSTNLTDSWLWDLSGRAPREIPVPDDFEDELRERFQDDGIEENYLILRAHDAGDHMSLGSARLLRHHTGPSFESASVEIDNVGGKAALSPDGTRLAHERCTSVDDWQGQFEIGIGCDFLDTNVVDLSSGEVLAVLRSPDATSTIAWSHDGARLTRTSITGTSTTWETTDWTMVETPFGRAEGEAHVVSYSPDGRYVATIAFDGTISLRDPRTGQILRSMTGTPNLIGPPDGSPWFNSDGSLMLTTFDGFIRLWDVDTATQIGDPFPHITTVGSEPPANEAGGASADSLQLATAVGDSILVWNLDTSTWYDIACRAAGRNLTRAEWDQFGPTDTDYRATCPQYDIEG